MKLNESFILFWSHRTSLNKINLGVVQLQFKLLSFVSKFLLKLYLFCFISIYIYHIANIFLFDCSLAFSVTLFCTEAAIAIAVLLFRRNKAVGGELGGPAMLKYVTATILIGLWLFYLIMSSLEAYGIIKGF